MITLRGKLKKDSDIASAKNRDYNKRISVRDTLLVKEVQWCRDVWSYFEDIELMVTSWHAIGLLKLFSVLKLFRFKKWSKPYQVHAVLHLTIRIVCTNLRYWLFPMKDIGQKVDSSFRFMYPKTIIWL